MNDTTTETKYGATIAEWAEHWNAYHDLSGDADCASPDSADSAGARMLSSVRSSVIELIEYNAEEIDGPEWLDGADDNGAVSEIADNAPDVYTHQRWAEFVDLGAYNEDPSDFIDMSGNVDMTQVAGVALYMIADRLARAMLADLLDRIETVDAEAV